MNIILLLFTLFHCFHFTSYSFFSSFFFFSTSSFDYFFRLYLEQTATGKIVLIILGSNCIPQTKNGSIYKHLDGIVKFYRGYSNLYVLRYIDSFNIPTQFTPVYAIIYRKLGLSRRNIIHHLITYLKK